MRKEIRKEIREKIKKEMKQENRTEFEVRTDLAVEEQERFPGDGGEISCVSLR